MSEDAPNAAASEPTPELRASYETREAILTGSTRSTESLSTVMEVVNALGGPAAVVTGAGVVAKQVKDVVVAKIQANAQIEVARIENGYRPEGGAHRADD